MSILDLFRPKYKNSNPSVRSDAAEKLEDQEKLAKIALHDSGESVRQTAVKKITNQQVLAKVARTDPVVALRKMAVERLTDETVLAEITTSDHAVEVSRAAIDRILDQQILVEVAKSNAVVTVRQIAIGNLSDENLLTEIAQSDEDADIRKIAVEKLDDEKVLVEIAKSDPVTEVSKVAVERIRHPQLLADIAKSSVAAQVCKMAVEKITDVTVLTKIVRSEAVPYGVRLTTTERILQLSKADADTIAFAAKNVLVKAAWESGLALETRQSLYADAEGKFLQALEVDSQCVMALVGLGQILAKRDRRYAEAIALYDKALNLDPANSEAWMLKTASLIDSGNRSEARVCIDQAIEQEETSEGRNMLKRMRRRWFGV